MPDDRLFRDELEKVLFGKQLTYLDDLDLDQMTDEQKAAFQEMLENDPYKFYSLWRDPDAAQRHFEGDDFQTTPASEVYTRIGALTAAGAPGHVIEYWKQLLETSGRPNDVFKKAKQPRTKPVKSRLAQVEAFCKYLEEYLNLDDAEPIESNLDNPYDEHWDKVMNAALGIEEDDEPMHGVDVKHYRDTKNGHASTGCEIVEARFHVRSATFDIQEMLDVAPCESFRIRLDGSEFVVEFFFYGCYV